MEDGNIQDVPSVRCMSYRIAIDADWSRKDTRRSVLQPERLKEVLFSITWKEERRKAWS